MDRKATTACIEKSRWQQVYVVWDVHPYDMQDEVSLKIEKGKVSQFRKDLVWAIEEYNPVFVGVNDFYRNKILTRSNLFTLSSPVLRVMDDLQSVVDP